MVLVEITYINILTMISTMVVVNMTVLIFIVRMMMSQGFYHYLVNAPIKEVRFHSKKVLRRSFRVDRRQV